MIPVKDKLIEPGTCFTLPSFSTLVISPSSVTHPHLPSCYIEPNEVVMEELNFLRNQAVHQKSTVHIHLVQLIQLQKNK